MSILRCQSCRILVDVAAASAARCSACGGPLEHASAPSTIWDDDDPTVRRPTSYVDELARSNR